MFRFELVKQRQPNEIPLELIRKMNTVNDEKQLLSEFVEDMPEEIAFASVAGTYGSGRVAGGDGGGSKFIPQVFAPVAEKGANLIKKS